MVNYVVTKLKVFVDGNSESEFYTFTKGLFIWAEVIPVSEKTFRQVYERDLVLLRK
jgi:hypothetical protein